MIPTIVDDINECLMRPQIESSDGVSLSFDLWMSRGHEDVLDIFAHFIDDGFVPQHVHVAMLRCGNSDGVSLAQKLHGVIDKFGLYEKVIACVSDGGRNMKTCMRVLKESIPCNSLTEKLPFKGACLAHKLSLIFKHVFSATLSDGLQHI